MSTKQELLEGTWYRLPSEAKIRVDGKVVEDSELGSTVYQTRDDRIE